MAAQMGYGFSVVLGSDKYYPKAGYVSAEQYGIKAPFDVPIKNFMALDLQGDLRKLNGTVEYAREISRGIITSQIPVYRCDYEQTVK
jgi:predicted N-acetyltransferase YhbS